MPLLIHDASVLIDLLDIALLDEALTLPFAMETTDLVQYELLDPRKAEALAACVSKGAISILYSTEDQVNAIADFQTTSPQLSLTDCSVIIHARAKTGIVLSGDRQLRVAAERLGIEVHGTPWLLNIMVEVGSLSPRKAVGRLERLMSLNDRLPHRACLRLIEGWRVQDRED